MKHASIVPLIGGEIIGAERAFGVPPEYMLSYEAFASNDSHIRNYYDYRNVSVPYHVLDVDGTPSFSTSVDAVSSVCPCAGLSQLSVTASADNAANDWMYKTAEYVMGEVKPQVYWGENAPGLVTGAGEKVRERLEHIASLNGYTASYYKTQTILHGLPQVRNRTFFFFWKGDKAPVFKRFSKAPPTIVELFDGITSNFQHDVINAKTPSKDDPYYEYILSEMHNGISHQKFISDVLKSEDIRANDAMSYIEDNEGYDKVIDWFDKKGYTKYATRTRVVRDKLAAGGSVMRRNTILSKTRIGAFVGHYTTMLAHPKEDRYITYREAMTIMGLPSDFELLNPKKNANHICQNVPVTTAADMASEVVRALSSPTDMEWTDRVHIHNNVNGEIRYTSDAKSSSLSAFF